MLIGRDVPGLERFRPLLVVLVFLTTKGARISLKFGLEGAVCVFLGDQLLAYLVLAMGGALLVGNILALVKPPPEAKEGELARAPVARSLVMAGIGLIAAVWAIASLISG